MKNFRRNMRKLGKKIRGSRGKPVREIREEVYEDLYRNMFNIMSIDINNNRQIELLLFNENLDIFMMTLAPEYLLSAYHKLMEDLENAKLFKTDPIEASKNQ